MGDKQNGFSISFSANAQKKRSKNIKIQDDKEEKREEIRSFGGDAGTSLTEKHDEDLPAIEALPNTFRCDILACITIFIGFIDH